VWDSSNSKNSTKDVSINGNNGGCHSKAKEKIYVIYASTLT
jgi:hypothetical protein